MDKVDKWIHFESRVERSDKGLREFYVAVPDEVATLFVTGRMPERVRCRVNDRVTFQCAIRPFRGNGFYVNVATDIRRSAGLQLGNAVQVSLQKDDSEYGRDMPEELGELLEQDPEGNELFQKMIPSKQRGIIHYIASAKSVQVRVDRAIKMINRLKNGLI